MSLERYRAIVQAQQRKVDRLVSTSGVAPVRGVFDDILRALVASLSGLPPSFDRTVKEGMLAQVRAVMARFVARGGDELARASAAAMTQAAGQSFQLLAQMEHQFTGAVVPIPLDEIAILKRATPRASSLLSVHRRSLAKYGASTVVEIETQTAVGLALGENTNQIIDRVQATANNEWYQAERIVRTEMAHAYNASHRDAIEVEAAEFDGDVWAQWSEHVSDDGAPLDNRVAVDSLAMHGQVARTGEVFHMPPTAPQADSKGRTDVPPQLVGRTWEHPPNRPNNRSTLVPWRPHWNVPGWQWRDGLRVPVTGGGTRGRGGAAAPEPATPATPARPAAEAPDGFDWRVPVDGRPLYQEAPEVRRGLPSYKEVQEVGAETMFVAKPSELAERHITGIVMPGARAQRIASVRSAWDEGKGLAPLEVKIDRRGRMFVEDGNHRLQAAAEDGDREVGIRFRPAAFDLDPGDDIKADLIAALERMRRLAG